MRQTNLAGKLLVPILESPYSSYLLRTGSPNRVREVSVGDYMDEQALEPSLDQLTFVRSL